MSLSFSDLRSRVSTVLHRKDLSICTVLVFYLGVFTVAATGLLFYATNPEYFERSVPTISRTGSYPPTSYLFATGMVLVSVCIFVTWVLARGAHRDVIAKLIHDPDQADRAKLLNDTAAYFGCLAGFCLGSMGVVSLEISNFLHMLLSWGFFVTQIAAFLLDSWLSLMLRRVSRSMNSGPVYDPNGRHWVCLTVCVFALLFLFMFYAKDEKIFDDRMLAQWIFVSGEYIVAFFSFYYAFRFRPLAREYARTRLARRGFAGPSEMAAELAPVPVRSRR